MALTTPLSRARRLLTRRCWIGPAWNLRVAPWALDTWEFCVEPLANVRAIAASLALDGYPARWPKRKRPTFNFFELQAQRPTRTRRPR